MTLEERIELHEQWLRSMESNQTQFVANMATLDRRLNELSRIVVTLGQNKTVLFTAMANFSSGMDDLRAEMKALAEQHRKLEDTVDRYIRYRGNGKQEN